jgi:hypothetical protein
VCSVTLSTVEPGVRGVACLDNMDGAEEEVFRPEGGGVNVNEKEVVRGRADAS